MRGVKRWDEMGLNDGPVGDPKSETQGGDTSQ